MPIVVLLLGLAVGTQIEGGTMVHVARVVVEAIGIGLIVGLALTWLTILMLRFAERRGWIGERLPLTTGEIIANSGIAHQGGIVSGKRFASKTAEDGKPWQMNPAELQMKVCLTMPHAWP